MLLGLAITFLRLGLTAFGGPAAHVGLMRDEFVRRRGWIDDAAFIDLVGASNLIPGPTSTELAMHIGHRRAGYPGLIVAGVAFLLPAVAIVAILAWLYVDTGTRFGLETLLVGVAPVVVAIVAHAGGVLARTALADPLHVVLAGLTVGGVVVGLPEIALLLAMGVLGLAVASVRRGAAGELASIGPAITVAPTASEWASGGRPGPVVVGVAAAAALAATPLAIFLEFLKIGAVLFGSGYVLVALLRSELVAGLGWITERQLIDAVAVGQATPGPLFSTATFVGYLVAGPIGAAAATVGVFLPAFIAVAVSIPVLGRLRSSTRARAFLDGVNAGAVGLIAVVAIQLAVGTLGDPVSVVAAVVAIGLLLRGVGASWLIAGGVVLGIALTALSG